MYTVSINITEITLRKIQMDGAGSSSRLFHIMQDLDNYAKLHIGDTDQAFLREKLRFLHKSLNNGKLKSTVRGILTYFSRWNKFKIWTKIVDIINFTSNEILGKSTLYSEPYVVTNRIISPIDIVAFDGKDRDTLKIKSE